MNSLYNDIEWNIMRYMRSAARSVKTGRVLCYFVGSSWLACRESYYESNR